MEDKSIVQVIDDELFAQLARRAFSRGWQRRINSLSFDDSLEGVIVPNFKIYPYTDNTDFGAQPVYDVIKRKPGCKLIRFSGTKRYYQVNGQRIGYVHHGFLFDDVIKEEAADYRRVLFAKEKLIAIYRW
jgi:hypothetical protein